MIEDEQEDLWPWLKDQPQDVWLQFVRCANWDDADFYFEKMVEHPECDLAVAAHLFWVSGPMYFVSNPAEYSGSINEKIIKNIEKGFYRRDLYIGREELMHRVDAGEWTKNVPFAIPRALFGPFGKRKARLKAGYDSKKLLEAHFGYPDPLPRTEQEYERSQKEGGNWPLLAVLPPTVPPDPLNALSHLSNADYAAALYGSTVEKDRLLKAARKRKWSLGRIMFWQLIAGAILFVAVLIAHRIRTGYW